MPSIEVSESDFEFLTARAVQFDIPIEDLLEAMIAKERLIAKGELEVKQDIAQPHRSSSKNDIERPHRRWGM